MRNTLIMATVAGILLFASCQNSGSGNAVATDSTAAPVETKQERNKKVVMASIEAMMKKILMECLSTELIVVLLTMVMAQFPRRPTKTALSK